MSWSLVTDPIFCVLMRVQQKVLCEIKNGFHDVNQYIFAHFFAPNLSFLSAIFAEIFVKVCDMITIFLKNYKKYIYHSHIPGGPTLFVASI